MLRFLLVVTPLLSLACAANVKVPGDVGVPLIDPAESSVRPGGNEPELIDHR